MKIKHFVRNILIGCCVLITSSVKAQQYDQSMSIPSIALGNQSLLLGNSFSALGNPAALTCSFSHLIPQNLIGITVSNKFFLHGLKLGGFGISHKISNTDVCAITIQFEGTANLRQTNIAFAYSKKVNDRFSLGISIIDINVFEQTIGSENKILGKAGICYQPSKLIQVAATIYNPFATKLTSLSMERIPTFLAAGICYLVSKQVKVYAEYKLGLNSVRDFKLGLSYEPKPHVIIFGGYQNTNSPLSIGITLKTKTINISIASQYHQILGFSPAFGFDYEKK